jgi:hypothetical protein
MNETYQLASELKEAGFRQYGKGEEIDPDGNIYRRGAARADRYVYLPTLEELIEACGERLSALDHVENDDGEMEWCASSTDNVRAYAPFPTEAVTRLYIALNKKS